ncbi:MAG: glycosyltransferase family 2 protein [Nanoarchaeota archaeon]|nr:glycosyltransferase family 2 protein [Nanoarchaeota archaeon]
MKKVKISVIIPTYNAKKTISACLSAIFKSDYGNFEVIVVDDNSNDDSVDIVKKFPVKLIQSKRNLGAGASRNSGAKISKGDILLFVDGDVVINKDHIRNVAEDFENNPDVSVVQGVYSLDCRFKNLGSKYANLSYYFYGNNIKTKFLTTLVTYFVGIRKKIYMDVNGFDVDKYGRTTVGEDQTLGHKLTGKGAKILLDKKIKVEHYKHYSAWKYLTHDTQTGAWQMRYMLKNRYKFFSKAVKKNQVGVLIPATFVYSVALSPIVLLSLLASIIFLANPIALGVFIASTALFFSLNLKFLLFTLRRAGIWFFISSVIFTYLRMMFAFLGGIMGLFEFVFFSRSKKIIT